MCVCHLQNRQRPPQAAIPPTIVCPWLHDTFGGRDELNTSQCDSFASLVIQPEWFVSLCSLLFAHSHWHPRSTICASNHIFAHYYTLHLKTGTSVVFVGGQ
eukprot:EG_transcript_38236